MPPMNEILSMYAMDYNVPDEINFSKQRLVGKGAFGCVYDLGKKDGKDLVHKIEVVSTTNQSRVKMFDEVIYKGAGILDCDNVNYQVSDSELNRLKGSVAAYVSLNWLHDNKYTQKLAEKDFRKSRDFMHLGRHLLQRTIMCYEEGFSLGDSDRDTLEPTQIINLARSLADILSDLDKNKLIHRDIKPGNIIESKNDRYRLIDFSSMLITPSCPQYNNLPQDFKTLFEEEQEPRGVGTLPYMDLDAILGKPTMASDIHAFGITLYFLSTGKHPFLNAFSQSNPIKAFYALGQQEKVNRSKYENNFTFFGIPKKISKTMSNLFHPTHNARYDALEKLQEQLKDDVELKKEVEPKKIIDNEDSTVIISHPSYPAFHAAQTADKINLPTTQVSLLRK